MFLRETHGVFHSVRWSRRTRTVFWPILYVSLVILFQSNGLSALKSKNPPACAIKRFLLLCTANPRDVRNPSTWILELSGVSKEEGVRRKAPKPLFYLGLFSAGCALAGFSCPDWVIQTDRKIEHETYLQPASTRGCPPQRTNLQTAASLESPYSPE